LKIGQHELLELTRHNSHSFLSQLKDTYNGCRVNPQYYAILHYRTKVSIINYLDCFHVTKILHTRIPHSPGGLWIRCILWIGYDYVLWMSKTTKIHRPVVSTPTDAGVSLDVSHRGFLRFGFCAIWRLMTVLFSKYAKIWTSSVVAAFLF
jgi:hypothetical protein